MFVNKSNCQFVSDVYTLFINGPNCNYFEKIFIFFKKKKLTFNFILFCQLYPTSFTSFNKCYKKSNYFFLLFSLFNFLFGGGVRCPLKKPTILRCMHPLLYHNVPPTVPTISFSFPQRAPLSFFFPLFHEIYNFRFILFDSC